MKFVRFEARPGDPKLGVVDGDRYRVVDGHTDLLPLLEQGEEAVVGNAILNDGSGRDVPHEEMLPSMGPEKGKDTATSLGPWFVTKDELEPYRTATGFDLPMSLSVNDVEYSSADGGDVHSSFGEMVSYASRGFEVRPGDVIGSGTCGTGCILELSRTHSSARSPWLQPGDEVVASIGGLGTQRSVVVAGAEHIPFRAKAA